MCVCVCVFTDMHTKQSYLLGLLSLNVRYFAVFIAQELLGSPPTIILIYHSTDMIEIHL